MSKSVIFYENVFNVVEAFADWAFYLWFFFKYK